jgi:hypothetical protein
MSIFNTVRLNCAESLSSVELHTVPLEEIARGVPNLKISPQLSTS